MIDPGIKADDPEYKVFVESSKGGHWVTQSKESDEPLIGTVWPGPSVFPDFTALETRKWWGDLFAEFMAKGVDGVWNDMNEIASFQEGGTIPKLSYHPKADVSLGGPDSQSRYHNVYGMMMAQASRAGVMKGTKLFFMEYLTHQ